MLVKISKWGNSLGIRLPKDLTRQIKLDEGDELDISCDGEKVILIPHSSRPQYTLDRLLDGMEEKHLHGEVDWGEPKGKEAW